MDRHLELVARLAQPAQTKIILLVLDGVGDIRTAEQPQTPLELAACPHLDALATRSALGRIVPVAPGVTPGSGPGHLALFGYHPLSPAADIGRGALEAMGMGVELGAGDVVARGNFATLDAAGRIVDRRAGRIPTAENRRLVERLNDALAGESFAGVTPSVHSGEGHRFVLRLAGADLSPELADTDPQKTGVEPLPVSATAPAAEATVRRLAPVVDALRSALADEEQANGFLLRGFDSAPCLPQMDELYGLRLGCFAGYPLYRGVARACGMEVVEVGKPFAELVTAVEEHWQRFDFFFLHVKGTDMAGEDGDTDAKVAVLEEVDRDLARLLQLGPDVVAVTGDHATPAPMARHSWHPVPVLVHGPYCDVDTETAFTEPAARNGALGTFESHQLLGLLLANAGRLAKFGA